MRVKLMRCTEPGRDQREAWIATLAEAEPREFGAGRYSRMENFKADTLVGS